VALGRKTIVQSIAVYSGTNRESVSGGFEGCPHSYVYRRIPTVTSSGSPTTIAEHCNPELARCCAIYNLSVFFLGCCLTLWSFLVQIGQVLFVATAWPSTRITGFVCGVDDCAKRRNIGANSLPYRAGFHEEDFPNVPIEILEAVPIHEAMVLRVIVSVAAGGNRLTNCLVDLVAGIAG
jgi:hypothetical protein